MKKTKVRRFIILGDKVELTTRQVEQVPISEPEETELKPPKKEK